MKSNDENENRIGFEAWLFWLVAIAALVAMIVHNYGCALKAGTEDVAGDSTKNTVVEIPDADVDIDPSIFGGPTIGAPTSQPHQQSGGLNVHTGDKTYPADMWMPRAALALVALVLWFSHRREIARIRGRQ